MPEKRVLVRVFPVFLVVALLGCNQPFGQTPGSRVGVLQVRVVPEAQVEASQGVAAEIMPVLEALFWGTIEDRRALVQYISVGCTTADGLGGPPKCPPGKAEGTVVETFPVGEAEGTFINPEDIDRTLELLSVDALYAVYQPVPGVDPIEYWPVGEYALIFERKMHDSSMPLTVFVQDGKMVRLGFTNSPIEPARLLSDIPLDRVLMSPDEARRLTEQVQTPR